MLHIQQEILGCQTGGGTEPLAGDTIHREQHLAHVGGGDFGFTANGVLAGSVGPGSPRVVGHGCLAPAAPLLKAEMSYFCASLLKSLRACTLQSSGFLKQYQGKGMHVLDYARGKPEVVRTFTQLSTGEKEKKTLQRCLQERGLA